MICPSPPDDDFNVAFVVILAIAVIVFGYAKTLEQEPPAAEASP
jgi:hypothetical protein